MVDFKENLPPNERLKRLKLLRQKKDEDEQELQKKQQELDDLERELEDGEEKALDDQALEEVSEQARPAQDEPESIEELVQEAPQAPPQDRELYQSASAANRNIEYLTRPNLSLEQREASQRNLYQNLLAVRERAGGADMNQLYAMRDHLQELQRQSPEGDPNHYQARAINLLKDITQNAYRQQQEQYSGRQ